MSNERLYFTFTTEVANTTSESVRRQDIMDAYDILGASPDDPYLKLARRTRTCPTI